ACYSNELGSRTAPALASSFTAMVQFHSVTGHEWPTSAEKRDAQASAGTGRQTEGESPMASKDKRLIARSIAVGALILFPASGCTNIGPEALPRDRIDYAGAIGDS